MARFLIVAAALAVAACASAAEPPPSAPPAEAPDQCKASDYSWLVGRNRDEVPAKPDGAVWRIHCTECAVTMDYNPARMNIAFDQETEVIKTVSCG